eukprot:9445283-Lingulodinium_polyedra.AAC.1
MAKRAVIDIVNRRLHLCGSGDLELKFPPGSQIFELEQSFSGRVLLPVPDFHTSDEFAPQRP